MKSARELFVPVSLAALLAACGQRTETAGPPTQAAEQELWKMATLRFEPLPAEASNPDNPATPARVELGRKLYLDTRLSKQQNISCDSCHDLDRFGVDNLPTSPGDAGERGERNSPTVFNAALQMAQFWDGRAADVEEQAGMPILNPVEMAIPSRQFLVDRLSAVEEYQQFFAQAFPEETPPLTFSNVARALAAFERTLLTPARFDDYLNGDLEALTGQEKVGLELFIESGCSTCHNGTSVGGGSFQKFGLLDDYWLHTLSESVDEGRYRHTGDPADRYIFKVATLRNSEKTAPYFHDGSVSELEEAIRVMGRTQLGRELNDAEVTRLAAFLKSLTGKLPEDISAAS
jgi:cytochrome c peroxidase